MEIEKLQRFLVYVLRHHPAELEISLGKDGFVDMQSILNGLKKHKSYSWAKYQDIVEAVNSQKDKQRLEIQGNQIRARYGHSNRASEEIHYNPAAPPQFLYHGTAESNLASIFQNGLLPVSRKYVHLSDTKEIAQRVARRHSQKTCLLVVLCEEAKKAGISFYHPEPQIWLVEKMPPGFLKTL
ncbi:MAG: RNA 2'-phosphotransferase [Candidatus Brocadiae bacterium]|nr:RNA 2'-phosphotransferase [Candidatus Brocadiia bacterium]